MSHPWLPLTRYVPRGCNAWYDIQRFSQRRSLAVFFDVGANVGQTARSAAQFFPTARIYSVEPSRNPFEALKNNCRGYSNVRCIHTALGSTVGETVDNFCSTNDIRTIDVLKMDVQGWFWPVERQVRCGHALESEIQILPGTPLPTYTLPHACMKTTRRTRDRASPHLR